MRRRPTIKQLMTHKSGYKGYYFETPMIQNFLKGRNDFYGIGDSMVLARLEKTQIALAGSRMSDGNGDLGIQPEKNKAVVVLSNLPPKEKIPATVLGIKRLTGDD